MSTPVVLISFDGKKLGRQYLLENELLIGRLPECHIQLIDSQVSKRHARIYAKGTPATCWVEDLESRNGVYVNAEKLTAARQLLPNDTITVGAQSFVFDPQLELLPGAEPEQSVVLVAGDSTTSAGSSQPVPAEPELAELPPRLLGELLAQLSKSSERPLDDLLACLKTAIEFDLAAVLQVDNGRITEPLCLTGSTPVLAISRTIAEQALVERRGLLLQDALGDPIFGQGKSVVQGRLRSILAVPLVVREQPAGLLFLARNKAGAYSGADLRLLLQAAPLFALGVLQAARLAEVDRRIERVRQVAEGPVEIIGASPVIEDLRKAIRKSAPTPTTVLITGETGTGKELVAQWLHTQGGEGDRRFVAINCGAIPENLVESEFFGHEKGAFSGADRQKSGKLELASGGTLFLDEVGELPIALQAKLLRAIEQKTFYRLGGIRPIRVRFRLVCATHRDLKEMVAQGRFREDLYYRLNVLLLHVPALRERPEDIAPLAKHFVAQFGRELGKPLAGPDAAALKVLCAYPWPGNIRELRNVVERMAVLAETPELGLAQLPRELLAAPAAAAAHGLDLAKRTAALERTLIAQAMRASFGKKSAAARALGISRPTLDKKLEEYEVDWLDPAAEPKGRRP